MTTHAADSSVRVVFVKDWSEIPQRSLRACWFALEDPERPPRSLVSTYANLVGERRLFRSMDRASLRTVVEGLDRGLPTHSIRKVTDLIGVNRQSMSRLLDISPRTLARRRTLRAAESERLFRVSALFHKTLEVLGDRDEARRWFAAPKRALGGRSPLEFCESEVGAREVEDLLGRIEHGVYA